MFKTLRNRDLGCGVFLFSSGCYAKIRSFFIDKFCVLCYNAYKSKIKYKEGIPVKKITFGTPEKFVPTKFCKTLNPIETDVKYPFDMIKFTKIKSGVKLELPFDADAEYYGFGLQLKAMSYKNRKATVRTNSDPVYATGDSHAPVPFFVSTAGYGIFVDTLRYAEFIIGAQRADSKTAETESVVALSTDDLYGGKANGDKVISIYIPVAQGVDLYIFEGENITDVVSQYNMMAGGGPDVPEWGLGHLYRCCSKYDDKKIVECAKYFREKDIPCSILGLEPGWHTHAYSCTYKWNPELYPNREKMLEELRKMGYHLNLWEHAYVHPDSPIAEDIAGYSGDYKVFGGYVPDFSIDKAKKIFSEYHKKNIVNDVIDGFKLDECDSSDFNPSGWGFPNCSEFPGGMDGMQYHNILGILYQQTMLDALNGKKTLSEVRASGALAAPYPYVLYSDLYDHSDFIRGCVTSGFSGILWSPELRDAKSKRELLCRLQTVVFSVHCLINGWYCEEMPWLEFDCEEDVRYWLKLREQLVPMLKKSFDIYRDTGKAPMRALVSDYTNDRETYAIDDQYLFCEELMVAPVTEKQTERRVYIPKGKWVDFFTGEPVANGWINYIGENIAVYRKVSAV